MKSVDVKTENSKSFILTSVKGALIALSISLVFILIFAFLLRFIAIPDNIISPVNQVIKCISIFIGTLFSLKKLRQMGLITGLIVGVIFTLIAFLVFSLLSGNFEFSKSLINDVFFGGIIGAISGIISMTITK